MVSLGVAGAGGVAAVLGVAAVVCVSSAVAGELLQDFKVGYILGGTPRNIQIVELIAVVVASAVMYFPLVPAAPGQHQRGRYRLRRPPTLSAASRPHGAARPRHRGRRHAVAAGAGGHLHGHRA